MRLSPWCCTKPTIYIGASSDVLDRLLDVDTCHPVEEGQGKEGTEEEARVAFAPLIACERASIAILPLRDVCLQV